MNRMNLKVSLLAGASVPLVLAGTASGEFVGLKTVKKFVDPADIAADTNIPGITSLLVVNVYATFTPGDTAASVVGAGGSPAVGIPLQINTSDGTFFQHPFGAGNHGSPSAALVDFPGFNALKHDSFVTIGRKFDDDPVFGPDGTQIFGLDWTETRLTTSDEGAWRVIGLPPQGSAGVGDNPPDQVLIGQFTVANPGPNAGVFGTMFISVVHDRGGGNVGQDLFQVFFDNQLPAPGTLALLGVAGLLGTRRRRKRLRTHLSRSGGTILSPPRERACGVVGSFSFSSLRRTTLRCMNRINLKVSLLAGASVPLILAGAASGEVLGLKAAKKFVDPTDIAADTNLGGLITSLMVVNVYATFTPGDAAADVIAVGGSVALGILLEVNTRDGTFFQHPLGAAGHTSPSAVLANVPGFNSLKHDSFVTIGRKFDNDPVFGPDQTNVIGLDSWTDTQFTGSDEADWFITGFPPQGDPGQEPDNPPDQVLIGQFTVANPGPNGGVFGQMFVFGFHTNSAGVVETYTITGVFDNQVPAPGTLALLGVAGLMGGRRRRK